MTSKLMRDHIAKLSVETVDQLTERDIHELSDAAETAILSGGGFGWLSPPPKSVMDRIKRENGTIAKLRAEDSPTVYFRGTWLRPSNGRVTGVYGSQRILNGKPRRPHFGIDFAAPSGAPVVAPMGGKIVLAHKDMYYSGGTIILDHGHGLTSAFLHLSVLSVKVGQVVSRGQKIGAIGATGRATGPHLDWRINWFEQRVDPAYLLPANALN